jgi:hypothetical protein
MTVVIEIAILSSVNHKLIKQSQTNPIYHSNIIISTSTIQTTLKSINFPPPYIK